MARPLLLIRTMNTTMTNLETAKVIFKCRNCGHVSRQDVQHKGWNFVTPKTLDDRGFDARAIALCVCGKHVVGKAISGKFNPEKGCDGRCMGATGPSCECSCGGENHGASHA